MFDFHNTPDEREPLDALVRRHFSRIRHVHVNEMDGRHPGTGNLDFRPVFRLWRT
jgi:sugar phosphate isomerase/epimerase